MIKNHLSSNQRKIVHLNFISVIALVTLSLLLLLGIYFVTFVLTESRMSRSYNLATKTYYLAEAGINEAIWKLKNDDTTADGDEAWKDKFMTEPDCNNWSATLERTGVSALFEDSSYTVTIQNSSCARGQIISTAKITLPEGKTTQRIIKIKVFKTLNPAPIEDSALFTGGPSEVMTVRSSLLNVYDGNLFSNNNIIIRNGSTVNIYDNGGSPELEGQTMAAGNISVLGSTLTTTAQCAKNICQAGCDKCPPDVIDMPMIDFDSSAPESYKSKAEAAGTVYTSSEFEDLLWTNQNLTLNNEVTYVTGPIELRGGQIVTVNSGVLVADGTITIGERDCWTKTPTESRCGDSQITITHTPNIAAGLLTKNSISFGRYTLQIDIVGLVYATDKLDLVRVPQTVDVTGAMMARKISIINVAEGVTTWDSAIVKETIGTPAYSPVVTVEHWEESY